MSRKGKKIMIIHDILNNCNNRYLSNQCGECWDCSYKQYCPKDCELCLKYIHFPNKAPAGSPNRKYDCTRMADFYTCKYSCRYSSELSYALRNCKDLKDCNKLK